MKSLREMPKWYLPVIVLLVTPAIVILMLSGVSGSIVLRNRMGTLLYDPQLFRGFVSLLIFGIGLMSYFSVLMIDYTLRQADEESLNLGD